MAHQLVDLLRLAGLRIELGPAALRYLPSGANFAGPKAAEKLLHAGSRAIRAGAVAGVDQFDPRRRLQAGNQSLCPASSRRTSSSLGVTIRPGPPPNPGGNHHLGEPGPPRR